MKKVLTLVLALVLCFSLIGCGSTTEDDKFLVGAIYINGQNDTAGYTFAHHNGITKAMEQLGMDKSQLKIVDNVPEDDAKVTEAIATLASQGCKLIIGISFGYINAMNDADFVLSSHEGEEFIYVMEGTMEISYGQSSYLLNEGDSIYYDSIVPHHVHAYQGQEAKILAVVYTPI